MCSKLHKKETKCTGVRSRTDFVPLEKMDDNRLLDGIDKAKAALGAKFDIRQFHDAVLLGGSLPLTVLETIIDGYIAARLAKA